MNFSDALIAVKASSCMARAAWNGSCIFLVPSQSSGNSIYLPYIATRLVGGSIVPWVASQTDLLAEDWKFSLAVGPTTQL